MNELNITKKSRLFAQLFNIDNPKEKQPSDLFKGSECDIIALKFNVQAKDQIKTATDCLEKLLPDIEKPLMLYGTSDDEIDQILLPELIQKLDRQNCIISNANEKTYKAIIPSVISGNHYIVLKSPIDINLAKELNILAADMDLPLDKIIMNTDIGGLGYGYEYGFSIMEKVIIEGNNGDKYLDLPLLSDAALESLKTKEAKSDDFSTSWGTLDKRARMIELSAASGILAAGANIITLAYAENIEIMKGLFK